MSERGGEAGRRSRRRRPLDPPIVVSESQGIRYLHFGTEWIQGAMRVRRPTELVLDYQRHMMAWRLFLPGPARVLQIGLGAGAMSRFVHACLPDCATTVVELSPRVLQVVRTQFGLPEDERLSVEIDDGEAWLGHPARRGRFDVVQVDAYDRHARGPALDSAAFYLGCRRALREPGVLVVNLFGSEASYEPNLERIFAAFGGRVLVLPPVESGNTIVLGFRGPPIAVPWETLYERAQAVERETGLKARGWVNALRRRAGATAVDADGGAPSAAPDLAIPPGSPALLRC